MAAAAGLADPGADRLKDLGLGANLANVAFRTGEPVRDWWDKRQALALHAGTIDPFFQPVDAATADVGRERALDARARLPRADLPLEREHLGGARPRGHPPALRRLPAVRATRPGTASPLQFWLHWRGGTANAGAALAPRIFHELGENVETIVVSPRGRGTSRWYVGKGHVDFRQVWRDVHRSFTVDRARTYVAGHSMGGWGSFLLTILYPDRFAAALPASPPVTQGMWTGLDFAGCDDYEAGGYTPCYGGANDGDARVQHTRRLLENVRHVPWAIYHGAADELVPVSGVTRQVERLVQLGYRHRYYLFPRAGALRPADHRRVVRGRAVHAPLRASAEPVAGDLHPRHAVRARDRDDPVGRASRSSFSFDRAYWMSRLEPADPEAGVASFDGTSAAIPEQPHTAVPEAGGPAAIGQTGPFVMTGMQWLTGLAGDAPAPANEFTATLTGARGVRLNLERMGIDVTKPATATIETDTPLTLELRADWGPGEGRVRTFELPAGKNELELQPAG